MTTDFGTPPLVPVSWGELLDKITILEIKASRISASGALANVRRELALLRQVAAPALAEPAIAPLVRRLGSVNAMLWEVEDDIRRKEAAAEFDDAFVQLARAVYRSNDQRSALKRQINLALGSALIEEKLHPATGASGRG